MCRENLGSNAASYPTQRTSPGGGGADATPLACKMREVNLGLRRRRDPTAANPRLEGGNRPLRGAPAMMDKQQSEAVDPSLAGLLDLVCDLFEKACKRNSTPPTAGKFSGPIFLPRASSEVFANCWNWNWPTAAARGKRRPPTNIARLSAICARDRSIAAIDWRPADHRVPLAETLPATDGGQLQRRRSRRHGSLRTRPRHARSVGTTTSSGLRFRVIRKHAKGGLGEVFIAEDQELHREVALKQIQSQYADDTNSRTRFVLEAEVTGALEHPGIVPVYGLGTYADGRPFYAMRFIHGDSLKDAIDSFHDIDTGPARSRRASAGVAQVARPICRRLRCDRICP